VRLFSGDSITVADGGLDVRVTGGTPGDLHHHMFLRPDGRRLAFVWDRLGNPTVELRLRTRPGAVTLWGVDGTSRPWMAVEGRVLRNIPLARGRVRIFEITAPPSP
jgi:hypothetical protein